MRAADSPPHATCSSPCSYCPVLQGGTAAAEEEEALGAEEEEALGAAEEGDEAAEEGVKATGSAPTQRESPAVHGRPPSACSTELEPQR